jgi:hypothetical protein
VDVNLDTLKREILDHLEAAEVAVFRSSAGSLEGLPMILWDTEHHPDYQSFLAVAQRAGVKIVVFGAAEFEASDIETLLEQLGECNLTREERREYESRLREMRIFEGVTCSLELAFDYNSRLYVYEVQPDWYEEFLDMEDEILSQMAESDAPDDSLGGYFSKN